MFWIAGTLTHTGFSLGWAGAVCMGFYIGLVGASMGTARGANKGPPYRRDSWFLGLSWALRGVLVVSRVVSSLLFWALLLISSRCACEIEPQAPVSVVCSAPSCFTSRPAGSPRGAPKGRPRRLFGTPLWVQGHVYLAPSLLALAARRRQG